MAGRLTAKKRPTFAGDKRATSLLLGEGVTLSDLSRKWVSHHHTLVGFISRGL